jgi:uncharacterized protein HemX
MAAERKSGRGLAVLALLIALIALGFSVVAYERVGGSQALQAQVKSLQESVDAARQQTADALQRLEQTVRPPSTAQEQPPAPHR